MSMKGIELISRWEKFLHALVAISLLCISICILCYTAFNTVFLLISGHEPIHVFIMAIQDILLVIIVLELLWTVVTYIRMESIPLEPFLYVGIISSVRALVLHGTKTIEVTGEKLNLFEVILKPGLHVLEILIIAFAIYIIRASKKFLV
ncbi:MAG: phosphate-starvation-inducible PsiE family protein [Thermosulfidibacteraceae bacterium]